MLVFGGNDSKPTFNPTNPKETLVRGEGIRNPSSLAVDRAGNLYVADTANNRVVQITPAGAQAVLPFNGLKTPDRISVDPNDNVYVVESALNNNQARGLRLNARAGTVDALPPSPPGNANGQAYLIDVQADAKGNIYALDTGGTSSTSGLRCRLLVSPPDALRWRVLTEIDDCSAENFVVDDDGTLYVAAKPGIIEVSADGRQPERISIATTFPPLGIARDSKGRLYIAASWGDTIYVYDAGQQSQLKLTHLNPNSRSLLNAIAVDKDMNVYIAEPLQNFIVKVAP